MTKQIAFPRLRLPEGFSLVEVTLAIGIVSFCLFTMLGLLPTGLNTLRDAAAHTAQAQILQQVASQAQVLPYTNSSGGLTLPTFLNTNLFFDEAGLKTALAANARYEVTFNTLNPTYPGSERAPAISNSVTSIRINIRPTGQTRITNSYVIQVPRS